MPELLCVRFNRIYLALRKKNVTLHSLSSFLGFSDLSIIHWRRGERKIPLTAIERLAIKIGSTSEIILADTFQVSGKKQVVNYSEINYWRITDPEKEYEGLTAEEVKTVLEWKKLNPDWEP